MQLTPHASWLLKCSQLYDACCVRHGVMIVGPPGSGKTAMINTLSSALNAYTKRTHRVVTMNPKAITAEDMFGGADK